MLQDDYLDLFLKKLAPWEPLVNVGVFFLLSRRNLLFTYFDIVVLPLFLRFPFLFFIFSSITSSVSSIQIFKDLGNSSNFGLRMLEEGDLITHGTWYGDKTK